MTEYIAEMKTSKGGKVFIALDEPLVRCKDCKYRRVRRLDNKIFCWLTARAVDRNDYCSKGKL